MVDGLTLAMRVVLVQDEARGVPRAHVASLEHLTHPFDVDKPGVDPEDVLAGDEGAHHARGPAEDLSHGRILPVHA